MGRHLRYFPEGALVEITCRTLQGRLLLRPSPRLNDLALGVLGRAQARYQLTIHAFVVLSNHLHLLVSPESPQQLAAFMAFFSVNLAKEVGRLHEWHGTIWSRRYQAIVVSEEESSQVERLLYLLRHGVKEHLVADPRDWPGASGLGALLDGSPIEGTWIDRTLEHRLRRRLGTFDPRACESRETVHLSQLPCWRYLSPEQHRMRVADLIRIVDEEGQRLTEERGSPFGRERVLRQHPHERPMRTKRTPAPLVHAATKAVRQALVNAYRAFLSAYRHAADLLKCGDRLVRFPEGAFPPPLPASG